MLQGDAHGGLSLGFGRAACWVGVLGRREDSGKDRRPPWMLKGRVGVWVERSEQTQPPQGRATETPGDAETRAGGGLAPPGLERAGHSPTAQWLPRVYILASGQIMPVSQKS